MLSFPLDSLGVNDSQSSAERNGTPRIYSSVHIHREGVFGWCLHAGVQEGRGREREREKERKRGGREGEWLRVRISPFLHAGTIIMIVNFARFRNTYAFTSGGNERRAAPVTLLHTGSPTLGGGSAFVAWIHRCLLYGLERSIKSWVTLLCPPCASGYASTRSLC